MQLGDRRSFALATKQLLLPTLLRRARFLPVLKDRVSSEDFR